MSIEQIWAEYKNSVHAFLLSKVSNPADAEELLQDILLKTHLQIHQLKDQDSIKPWLFQIANHAIIDFYRKHNNYQHTELIEVIEKQDANIRADLIKCIEPFLQAMPEGEADLKVLFDRCCDFELDKQGNLIDYHRKPQHTEKPIK